MRAGSGPRPRGILSPLASMTTHARALPCTQPPCPPLHSSFPLAYGLWGALSAKSDIGQDAALRALEAQRRSVASPASEAQWRVLLQWAVVDHARRQERWARDGRGGGDRRIARSVAALPPARGPAEGILVQSGRRPRRAPHTSAEGVLAALCARVGLRADRLPAPGHALDRPAARDAGQERACASAPGVRSAVRARIGPIEFASIGVVPAGIMSTRGQHSSFVVRVRNCAAAVFLGSWPRAQSSMLEP